MVVKILDASLEKFIQNLETPTIARVVRTIELLEKFGNQLGMPHSKKVDSKLYELRIRGQQEIRILFAFHKGLIVLLHGFVKKSDKIPKREFETAHKKLSSLD